MNKTELLDKTSRLPSKYNYTPFMYIDYPHKSLWKPYGDGEVRTALSSLFLPNPKTPTMLYVHMPYCQIQCYFCTCHVLISSKYEDVRSYLKLLYREIELLHDYFEKNSMAPDIREIHLGGGSPTFIGEKDFDRLVEKLSLLADVKNLDEFAIEIDPRRIKKDRLVYYHSKGINRISFGVQDFDLEVQKAVNRVQPAELTESLLTPEVRKLFKNGVNFDILCGLPRQTLESIQETFKKIIKISPDRICLNYMDYAPKYAKHQMLMPQDELPDFHEKKNLFIEALDILTKSNYVRTGYDHFAKPTDVIAKAMKEKKMNWNQLGYTPGRVVDILAIGVSGSNRIGDYYYQNVYELSAYESKLKKGEFPAFRGIQLTRDDVIRRDVITSLRGFFSVDIGEIEKRFGIDFREYFKPELESIKEYVADGLVVLSCEAITITEVGYQFSNVVCSLFDKYVREGSAKKQHLDEPPARRGKNGRVGAGYSQG